MVSAENTGIAEGEKINHVHKPLSWHSCRVIGLQHCATKPSTIESYRLMTKTLHFCILDVETAFLSRYLSRNIETRHF